MPQESMIMLGAVVVWAIVGAINRLWGAFMGVLLVAGVGVWGWFAMEGGRSITVLGMRKPLSPVVFFGVLGVVALFNVITVVQAWRARRPRPAAHPE